MSKKGENIYKRKDNRWEARYIKTYASDGSAKYGYCYGKTYKEVKEKATKAKSQLLFGQPQDTNTGKKQLSYYCDEWLYLKRHHIKESSYVKYYNVIENHIKPCLGDCTIQSINAVAIEKFSQNLLGDEHLSPKTVKDILTVLHSIFIYKIITYIVVMLIMISITTVMIVLIFKFSSLEMTKWLAAIIPLMISFLTVFIVIPKIITNYLFDKDEENHMLELLKVLIEHDRR